MQTAAIPLDIVWYTLITHSQFRIMSRATMMMPSAGETTQLNYSFNGFYEAPSYSLLTSGNISCGLLNCSNLLDKWSNNASGGVEADSHSAIALRYFDIRYVRDHSCNYRREGKRGWREGLEEGVMKWREYRRGEGTKKKKEQVNVMPC